MNTLKRENRYSIANHACLVLALIMSFGVWNPATAESFPKTIPLPDGFQPEGITLGNGHTAYVGSLANGSIYEVDLRTGAGSILVPGLGPIAVGLDFDERSGYVFVAGGIFGDGRVYATDTGEMVAHFEFVPFGAGWINDVFVTREAAYFTDSFFPYIYKVPLDSQGVPSGLPQALQLGGDWAHTFPTSQEEIVINANGIVATPNGRTLIVVNYFSGLLYTVDPDTGYATEIDLGGMAVPSGDGLVLRGETLYVVLNANQIVVFTLSPDFSAATLTQVLGDSDFRVTSTADLFGPWLYTVNARFDVCFPLQWCPPDTDFDIVRVEQ